MDLPCIDLEATGRNIRSLRIANGFRVTDISAMLLLDKQAVYKWEYGKCLPQLENLFALGHLYQLKVEDIIVLKKEEASTSSFPFSVLVLLLIIFVCTAIYGISSRIRSSFPDPVLRSACGLRPRTASFSEARPRSRSAFSSAARPAYPAPP